MSEVRAETHVMAGDLNRAHLGRTVRTGTNGAVIQDILAGVSHQADLINDRPITQEAPSCTLGRTATTLTFASLGPVQVDGKAIVEVFT